MIPKLHRGEGLFQRFWPLCPICNGTSPRSFFGSGLEIAFHQPFDPLWDYSALHTIKCRKVRLDVQDRRAIDRIQPFHFQHIPFNPNQSNSRYPDGVGSMPGALGKDANLRHVRAPLRSANQIRRWIESGLMHEEHYDDVREPINALQTAGERALEVNLGLYAPPTLIHGITNR